MLERNSWWYYHKLWMQPLVEKSYKQYFVDFIISICLEDKYKLKKPKKVVCVCFCLVCAWVGQWYTKVLISLKYEWHQNSITKLQFNYFILTAAYATDRCSGVKRTEWHLKSTAPTNETAWRPNKSGKPNTIVNILLLSVSWLLSLRSISTLSSHSLSLFVLVIFISPSFPFIHW